MTITTKQVAQLEYAIKCAARTLKDAGSVVSEIVGEAKELEITREKIDVPAWLAERGYSNEYGGDAGKANSEYFQWWFKAGELETEIVILCPSCLRGSLKISIHKDGHISASY